jgi:hypothetical protein
MELLKVFVGDGASSAAAQSQTIAGITEGDIYLCRADNHAILTQAQAAGLGNDVAVKVVTKNSRGLKFSSPMTRNNVSYSSYKATTGYTPKNVTFTPAAGDIVTSTTYTLGVQIKEDLRMGTYNKNTEILTSYTTASSGTPTALEVISALAGGFSANPLTSGGSPYQLVKVVRTGSGTVTGLAATVVPGAREVTFASAHGKSVGDWVSLDGAAYQIEKLVGTGGVIVHLDTAYQGTTTSLASGTAQATGTSGTFGATPTSPKLEFYAVTQTMKNRYDQFRVVEFDVIYPKGWNASVPVVTTKTTNPVGSYRQIRDLSEKAFTNVNPLINYREFPFETFDMENGGVIPATATFTQFVFSHTLSNGYNYMQSSNKEFLQTTVCAVRSDSGSDGTVVDTDTTNNYFGSVIVGWYTASATPVASNKTFSDHTF